MLCTSRLLPRGHSHPQLAAAHSEDLYHKHPTPMVQMQRTFGGSCASPSSPPTTLTPAARKAAVRAEKELDLRGFSPPAAADMGSFSNRFSSAPRLSQRITLGMGPGPAMSSREARAEGAL